MTGLTAIQAARVLIVDDNRDMADTTAMLLKIRGYDVAVAYDGRSAINTAKGYDPDVVLLDLSLPDIDGYAVAANLRKDGLHRASFIALSGHGPDDDRSWEDLQFADYLVKPVGHGTLVSLLERIRAEKQA
jgi:CheY-like chemotaxis protein